MNRLLQYIASIGISLVCISSASEEQWTALIDVELSHWDVFMGAPHTSTEIEGYEKFEDVRVGTPIGLNEDPKNVFSVVENEGSLVLKITGEIFAGLVTKLEYGNYHLSWQFKWGETKWEPRLDKKRNSGILYHSIGDYTDFWNVWMTSLECEVQQTDCGDYISIGDVKATVRCALDGNKYRFDPAGQPVEFCWQKGFKDGRCYKPEPDPEFEHGKWNTMEIVAFENRAIHILNGKVVMVIENPMHNRDGMGWAPMTQGKIQIQSESAEIFYRDIKIKSISGFEERFKSYL